MCTNQLLTATSSVRVVDAIPRDIDGERHYVLAVPTMSFPVHVTREIAVMDERPWGTLKTTSLTLSGVKFEGDVRVATCKGGYRCDNKMCSFLMANKTPNVRSFRFNVANAGGVVPVAAVCSHCDGVTVTKLPCSATKKVAWERRTESSTRNIHILHTGRHTVGCFASNPRRRALDISDDIRGNLERLGAAGAPNGPAAQRSLVETASKFLDGNLSQEQFLEAGELIDNQCATYCIIG